MKKVKGTAIFTRQKVPTSQVVNLSLLSTERRGTAMYYHIPKHPSFDDLLLSLLPQMATWLPSTAALYSCETLLWTRDSTISSAGAELFPLASVKDLRNIISAMLSILFQTATQSFNKLCCERKANKEVQQKSQWNKRKRINWSCA